MRNKTLLYINRIIAFCCFLCAFGKLCFEFGFNVNYDGFEFLFIFPLFYLGILIASHKLFEEVCYTRKPYIIIASIIIAFILIMWIVFLLSYFSENTGVFFTSSDIWHDSIITVGSLAMSLIYYAIAVRFGHKS